MLVTLQYHSKYVSENTGLIVVQVSDLRRIECNWFHNWILQIIAPWLWVNMEIASSAVIPINGHATQ